MSKKDACYVCGKAMYKTFTSGKKASEHFKICRNKKCEMFNREVNFPWKTEISARPQLRLRFEDFTLGVKNKGNHFQATATATSEYIITATALTSVKALKKLIKAMTQFLVDGVNYGE